MDASRLGLWGWSGGGTNTLYCILNRPGVWKAGRGGRAGDRLEALRLGLDGALPRPRRRTTRTATGTPRRSPTPRNLKDRLLIVHGLADDNVHPQNTVVMSGELIKAGHAFEQAFYPGQKHGLRGASMRHFYRADDGVLRAGARWDSKATLPEYRFIDDRRVGAAEAEGVGERVLEVDVGRAGVGDEVEVAAFARARRG